MNQKLLTVLGCSSSVALTLFGTTSVQANTVTEYVFSAPEVEAEIANIPRRETDYPFYDCSCSEYNAIDLEKSDRQGAKAIDLYGCDCAGCRRLLTQYTN